MICAFLYLCFSIIFKQNTVNAINRNNSNRLNQTFWEQSPTDEEIVSAVFWSNSIYTKERQICTDREVEDDGDIIWCNAWWSYHWECANLHKDCISNPLNCTWLKYNHDYCENSPDDCTWTKVVHITWSNLNAYHSHAYGNQQDFIWEPYTIYVLETWYVILNSHETFGMYKCSAIISSIPWWSTILDNNAYDWDGGDNIIHLNDDNTIIDNINVDWAYKTLTTQKSPRDKRTTNVIYSQGIHWYYPNITNITINNIFISNIINRWIDLVWGYFRNLVINNATFYNVVDRYITSVPIYLGGVYHSQLNNIKIFNDTAKKIIISGWTWISLNNIYILPLGTDTIVTNPNNPSSPIYAYYNYYISLRFGADYIALNNIVGNIHNDAGVNCFANNVIWKIWWHRCTLYWYQKYFDNESWSAALPATSTLTIDDASPMIRWNAWTKEGLWCLNWNYIINPFTEAVNNYYKHNWFSSGITDYTWCIANIWTWNTTAIFSNSGLKYSYWINIPGQSQTVKFAWNNIVRWNLPANDQNGNYYIASSTTRRPNLSIVGNDEPLVSWYAQVKVLNGATSLPNATVFWPYISGTYETLWAASPYWTSPVPIIFKNPDTIWDRVLIWQVGFTDGFTHFTRVIPYATGNTNTPPTITPSYNPSPATRSQSKSLSATSDWTLTMREWFSSGCDSSLTDFVPYSDMTYTSENDNGKYICYRARNQYWTSYNVSEEVKKIDRTPPICLRWTPNNPNWADFLLQWQTWEITLSCSDDAAGAGIATTTLNTSDFTTNNSILAIDNVTAWWNSITRTFTVTYRAKVQSWEAHINIPAWKIQDNAGNQNTQEWSESIIIWNRMPPATPTCTPTTACFKDSSPTISCSTTTSDATIKYTSYTYDGALPNCNSTQRTNTPFSDTTTLKVIACSPAWVASSINTYHYTKDEQWPYPPTHISPNNNATTNKVRPTLKRNEPTDIWCSSVSSYEVRVCKQHCPWNIVATGATWGTSRDVPQNLEDWVNYFRQVIAKDNLGNRGERSNETKFTVDAVKPTCSRWTPTQQCISWWVAWTINLICTDAAWIATNSLSNDAIEYSGNLITLSNATVSNYSETYQVEEETTNPAISAIFKNDKDITTTLVSQSNAKMIAWLVPITLNGKKYTFTYTWKAGVNWSTTFTLKANKVRNPSDVYAPSVTSAIWITIDNSAPAVPTMVAEPRYTQWLTNTVSSNTVTDNGCDQTVQYQFNISETSTNYNALSSWTTSPTTTFYNLIDGKQYYYYVRAKDGLWNTSSWSSSTRSTQDNTRPTVTFDKNSWQAAPTHTVKVTITDTGSHLINNEKLYYRWQTSSTCSNIETNYTMTTSFTYNNWWVTARINVTTPESLPNGEYYLCILGNYIQDTVWNKNITTRTAWKFIKADVPPTVSATNSSTNWKSWDIQITLNVQSVTSLSYAKYSRESLAKCKSNGTSFTNWQQIQKTSEWTQTLYLCAQDTYGQTWEWSGTYKLDKTKPTWSFSGISQYCIPKNTYARVSITWNDSVSWFPPKPIKWNNETNRYEFTSTRNIAAGDTVTATIRDNAWNTTWLSAKVEKCPDEDNFEFKFSESSCTSWNITVTISWDYTHVTKYQRWDGTAWTTDNYRPFTENRSWQIKIELDNWTILSWPRLYLNVTNIDKEAPTVTIIDAPESVNECETWTIIFSVQDSLCWSWNITANITWNWTTINEVRNWSWEVIFTTRFADDSQNNWKINYVVTDSVWNKTTWQTIITLNNVPLTWRNFKRELIQVSSNQYVASWNWKELSRAKAWQCETITGTKDNSCNNSVLTVYNNPDRFIYTGNKNTKTCNFKLTDWDTTITLQWTFKYCNNPNDCAPTLYPKFISWTYYTEYNDKERGYNKYTSGTESSALVLIDIDWDGYSNMSWYRYSYIQGKNYCKELTDWKPCSTTFRWWAIPWFCEFLSWFLEANGTTNPKTCIAEEPSRTNWLPYPNDNIFQINIADSDKWSDTIPYQSAYQWPRQIWIQVQDSSGTGRTSAQVPTDVINYTTEKPYIKLAEDNNRKWWWRTIYTVNDNEFTIVLSANGADLENWFTWLNYNYYNSLTNDYPILIRSGVLKFDTFNQWLLSKYRGR